MRRTYKLQSAMEYMMTYSWALLIIAIVIAAFLYFGIFSPNSLTPKVSPGSCQVYRPYGPQTSLLENLQGTCTSGLPQDVGLFNGASSYIIVGNVISVPANGLFAISAWVLLNPSHGSNPVLACYPSGSSFLLGVNTGSASYPGFDVYMGSSGAQAGNTVAPSSNTWYYVVALYNGTYLKLYVNNVLSQSTLTATPAFTGVNFGYGGCTSDNYWNGYMSNVQFYNTSLTTNQINTLYYEGIGGDPLLLQNLQGWWPLNGGPTDYSGDLFNGNSINVNYVSYWASSYSAP